ncbi:MAG: TolC family protein [Deltaproteobacteria bacterium]|nr:TolC family protein [Deltaproteobacteria bacterium]
MIHLVLLATLAAEPQALSLDEALRQAVAHQPELQGARFDREASNAVLTQARSIEYPQVHADTQLFGATENNTAASYLSPGDFVRVGTRPHPESALSDATPFVSSLAGIGAHYDVLDFGFTKGTVGAAEAGLEATTQREHQTLQDVLLRVSTAYFGALASQQALGLAEDALKRVLTHDAYAKAGVKSGLKPPIDETRSEADVQAARLGVIRAQNALQVARAALDNAIGWVPPTNYQLAAPAADERPVPELQAATDQALTGRYDLQALQAQERAIEGQRTAAYSGHFPRLLATSSVSLRGFDEPPGTFNYDLGLVLSVPLFTGFAVSGAVEEADARLAALKAREVALRDAIGYELRQSSETLRSAREAVKASAAQVTAAQASLKQAEVRYEQGLGNIVELTDAEAQFDVAGLGLVQSQLDAAISRVQLDYALGQLRAP